MGRSAAPGAQYLAQCEVGRLNPSYPPLDKPPLAGGDLRKKLAVQTRYFYGNSVPGNRAVVIRYWEESPKGIWVRCNYGKNLSGQSLHKTMPIDALCLVAVPGDEPPSE